MTQPITAQQETALFVAAFFDELVRWGVRDVIVSPGSRSTALAMTAYELSRRRPADVKVFVDVDERGAAFLGLGLAKAGGRPVALVCTSGTALANYYPAVVEASTSRVPLLVLSGDRPSQLQGLGAPQTTDQLKAYGAFVRSFRAMPLPGGGEADIAFARQAAREACLAALGPGATLLPDDVESLPDTGNAEADAFLAGAGATSVNYNPHGQVASRGCDHYAGPVHINFPFAPPLKPDFSGADGQAALRGVRDCFMVGRISAEAVGADYREEAGLVARRRLALGPLIGSSGLLSAAAVAALEDTWRRRPTLVLVGEGTCSTLAEADEVIAWARRWSFPLLADPLSGLRSVDDPLVIDNYDNLCRHKTGVAPEVVIRFGRYPVSQAVTAFLDAAKPTTIVVDAAETRDFNCATGLFVGTTPLGFIRSLWSGEGRKVQRDFADKWISANDEERPRILSVKDESEVEGAYVRALLEEIPEGSCLFSANSMAIRALDTFYVKDGKPLAVMANRGQNGIDGVVSSAIGAAQCFGQTTLLTGDFTLLHDLNALALQHELGVVYAPKIGRHGASERKGPAYQEEAGSGLRPQVDPRGLQLPEIAPLTKGQSSKASLPNISPDESQEIVFDDDAPSLVIVLLNNNGGAIFDTLPQASVDPYFERLFLAPQNVDFQAAAAAFKVPSARAGSVAQFRRAYKHFLGKPGLSLIEIRLPLRGVGDRYAPYR